MVNFETKMSLYESILSCYGVVMVGGGGEGSRYFVCHCGICNEEGGGGGQEKYTSNNRGRGLPKNCKGKNLKSS